MEKPVRAHNFEDLSGKKFGLLAPLRVVQTGITTKWECICDCGKISIKRAQHLKMGLSKSCGCIRRAVAAEHLRKLSFVHGLSVSEKQLYSVWSGMMRRCYNKSDAAFPRYGGRGIDVCLEWHDPRAFVLDMAPRPDGMSIDRIDNNKGYSKDNCRWATIIEQNNNRRSTRLVELNGVVASIAQHAAAHGKNKTSVYSRLKAGMSLDEALTKPMQPRKNHI